MKYHHRGPRVAVIVGLFLAITIVSSVAAADDPLFRSPDWTLVPGVPAPPDLHGRAAVLVDVLTGTVLAARNPHLVIPAASLTKVVAIHAALEAESNGDVNLDEEFVPPPETWWTNQPAHSSLMFLGPEQVLPGRDLLPGLAVSSGNDAALALALLVDGSVPAFAERMNRVVAGAGLVSSSFVEPSGLDPWNLITAYEYAALVRVHVARFPGLLDEIYSLLDFTYPQERHMTGVGSISPIRQSNRNLLVGSYPGADGVKTGYIDESGYNLAVTAERHGRRLVAVVLGIDADSHAEGGRLRAEDGRALLDYGFENFTVLNFGLPPVESVRVFKGASPEVTPIVPASVAVSLPVGAAQRLEGAREQITELVGPVVRGTVIGSAAIMLDGVELARAEILMPEVERGGFFRRLWDGLGLFLRSLFGNERPVEATTLE